MSFPIQTLLSTTCRDRQPQNDPFELTLPSLVELSKPQTARHTEVSVPVFGPSTGTDFHASFIRASTPSNHEWNTLALNVFFSFTSFTILCAMMLNKSIFSAPVPPPSNVYGYVACFLCCAPPEGYFYGSLIFFRVLETLFFIPDLSRFRSIDSAIGKAQVTRNMLSELV